MIGDNARKLGLAPSSNQHGGRRRHRVALQEPKPSKGRAAQPLPGPSDWTCELIEQYHEVIKHTAERFGLDTYPNQLEVITAEQMMDAYASVGMPVNYRHWSYGKEFISNEKMYKRGQMGLAYEIVINSDPCIAYLMEENTMAMQALVIAHAAYGHNSFFKGNYLFKMWTDASSIIDYLVYAKNYVADCEEHYGLEAVEETLDSCHALANHGVDRYRRPMLSSRSTTCGARCRGALTKPRRRRARSASPSSRRKTCCTSSRRTRHCSSRGSARSCASCARSRSTSTRSGRRR